MRDDAARALRVEDDVPRLAELRAVTPDMPLPYEFPRDRYAAQQPRPAPGRSYGSHRRGEAPVAGYQPGRRTVAITGQVQQPRRRSTTAAAMVARPDRTALWAFLFALFLVVMAVATAHG